MGRPDRAGQMPQFFVPLASVDKRPVLMQELDRASPRLISFTTRFKLWGQYQGKDKHGGSTAATTAARDSLAATLRSKHLNDSVQDR